MDSLKSIDTAPLVISLDNLLQNCHTIKSKQNALNEILFWNVPQESKEPTISGQTSMPIIWYILEAIEVTSNTLNKMQIMIDKLK